ncbi:MULTISPECIES: hypothetical protein [Haloarcula]|uniref:hypothetical protein n=1 Tax=Haloarcula TaxID=2237 RepID=UPI0023ECD562|nr:hypothetical protein [Halomicroarcula sp. XH51]
MPTTFSPQTWPAAIPTLAHGLPTSSLVPVAFDVERAGLTDDAVVTVAGFAHEPGTVQVRNVEGRDGVRDALVDVLNATREGASS